MEVIKLEVDDERLSSEKQMNFCSKALSDFLGLEGKSWFCDEEMDRCIEGEITNKWFYLNVLVHGTGILVPKI